jgi:8-oxo-dGTP pyrophosphatase MutT (NUDIX family)
VSKVAEAGGIVFRYDEPEARFLLVKAKKDPDQWIFPKGHIESGESAEEAAVREVREEAGIETTMVVSVGVLDFDYSGETIEVEYFLLKFARTVGGGEQRESRWCTYDDAAALLTFADAKNLLRSSLKILEQHSDR